MAEGLQIKLTWQNLLLAVVFVIVAFIVMALIGMVVPFPSWLQAMLGAAVGVAAWYFFMARWKR